MINDQLFGNKQKGFDNFRSLITMDLITNNCQQQPGADSMKGVIKELILIIKNPVLI